MPDALDLHRFQFAFTITFHYLFPQLTMGLALLVLLLKTQYLRTGREHYNTGARFWGKILAIGFGMGVVTGVPMEFQFGTNWSRFSKAAGGVVGHTLAMEGVYSFFLESTFLGLFLFGEKLLGRVGHYVAAACVFLGSWLSAFFIVATVAWMQHPVGYRIEPNGTIALDSFWALLSNPWLPAQYAHTILGAVVTGSVAMAGTGAYYLLSGRHEAHARTFTRLGVVGGFLSSILLLFPTGDMQGSNVVKYQPVKLAALEGHFETGTAVPIVILGQPDVEKKKLDNPLTVPGLLSFLTTQRWHGEVKGLDAFPREDWPTNIPLVFYSFHIMAGLGTIFILVLGLASFLIFRDRLFRSRAMLWTLMLLVPFPFIANTAGWTAAEAGRQPWIIYGLMRTADGSSPMVSAGNTLFTLLGFMGMYAVLSILFLFLMHREIEHGPGE